ncbi:MAG: hypothetical protein EBX57_08440, partial [Betaproteobacteria bacterium]|nr:hypothetical protein [Betaproteobacteria bacterium]
MPDRRSEEAGSLGFSDFDLLFVEDFDKTYLRFKLYGLRISAKGRDLRTAQMAELVDALGSGPSGGNTV